MPSDAIPSRRSAPPCRRTFGRPILLIEVDEVLGRAALARPVTCAPAPVADLVLLLLLGPLVQVDQVLRRAAILSQMAPAPALVAELELGRFPLGVALAPAAVSPQTFGS